MQNICKQMDKTLKQGGPRVKICSYNTGKIFAYDILRYTVVLALLHVYVNKNITIQTK